MGGLMQTELVRQIRNALNLEFFQDGPLLESVTLTHLASGQTLFNQGEEAKNCFLVISGSLKIVMNSHGKESVLTIISKGELGGVLLMGSPSSSYPGSVVALTHASVLIIPRDTFNKYWVNEPLAVNFINNCVKNRVLRLQEDKAQQLSDVETRIIHFLNRHYIEKNDLQNKKITRKEIGLAIGAKTETVIRVLKKLERSGIIKTESSIIKILDKDSLKNGTKY